MMSMNNTKDPIVSREFFMLSIWAFLASNNFYSLLTAVPLFAMNKLGLGEAEAGLATGLFIAGMLCSRFAAGKLTEKLGFRTMLIGNLIFIIIFTLLYFVIANATSLYIIRILSGIFYGLLINTVHTMVSTIIPKSRTGEGIGYYAMIQMSSWAVGPSLSLFFANRGDFSSIFIYCTILPVIILITVPFFRMSRVHEALASDKALRGGVEPVLTNEGATIPMHRETLLEKFLAPSVLPISAVCLFFLMFNTAASSFAAPFAATIGLAEPASAFFIFYAIGMLGIRPIISRVFDKKGGTFALIPSVCIYVIAYLILASISSPFTLLLSALLLGVGFGACQNTALALSLKTVPRKRLGFANATFYATLDGCSALGPIIAGLLIPSLGYRYMYTVAAIWTAVGLIMYFVLRPIINKSIAAQQTTLK